MQRIIELEKYVEILELLIPEIVNSKEKDSQKFLNLLDRLNKLSVMW